LLLGGLFALHLGVGGAFALEPVRVLVLDRVDLLGGERLREPGAGESADRDAELRGDHGARVGAVAAQVAQPLGRRGLQLVEFVAGYHALLKLGGRGFEVDPQLLRRGGGLHRLGGLARRHGSRVSAGTCPPTTPGNLAGWAPLTRATSRRCSGSPMSPGSSRTRGCGNGANAAPTSDCSWSRCRPL